MRRRQPQPKDKRRIPIPDTLRAALLEAFEIIRESKRAPDVRVDYDDAIQCGGLIGGRVGTKKRPFLFSYRVPGSDARWHLGLHPLDIEDIADGRAAEITLYCCRNADCGFKTDDPEETCRCDFVEDPYWGNIELAHTVEALRLRGIAGIGDQSTADDVRAVLGEPELTGGNERLPRIGFVYPWIKYLRPDCQLRFEFHKSGALRMVSIDPDVRPRQ